MYLSSCLHSELTWDLVLDKVPVCYQELFTMGPLPRNGMSVSLAELLAVFPACVICEKGTERTECLLKAKQSLEYLWSLKDYHGPVGS